MIFTRFRHFILLVLSIGLIASAHGQSQTPWWNFSWEYRVPVKVDQGSWGQQVDAAWVQFNLPEAATAEGHDIRVTDSKGQLLQHELKFYQPGIYAIVAFEIRPGESDYYVYFGNKKAKPTKEKWLAKAGVFLETRYLINRGFRNLPAARKVVKSPADSFGAGYVENIHQGYNPFGEPDRYLGIYSAWLEIKSKRKYTFCAIADDMAYLMIDGVPVCNSAGRNPRSKILKRQTGSIELKPGLHHVEYYHFEWYGGQTAILGWKQESDKQFELLSPLDFAHILEGEAQGLEAKGEALTSNMEYSQNDYLLKYGQTFTDYTFRNLTADPDEIKKSAWEFSDGYTAEGVEISRPFFSKDMYSVKLTTEDKAGRTSTVSWPLKAFAIEKPEDTVEAKIIRDFQKRAQNFPTYICDDTSVNQLGIFLENEGQVAQAGELYQSAIRYRRKQGEEPPISILIRLTELASRLEFKDPASAHKLIIQNAQFIKPDHPLRAAFYTALSALENKRLHKPELALGSARTALRAMKGGSWELQRDTWIAVGDAYKHQGNSNEAHDAYKKASEVARTKGLPSFQVSSYALTVESYLMRNELEAAAQVLKSWQLEFPLERITGNASILQAKLYAARGESDAAIYELRGFLACQDYGVFAQQAWELLGDIQAKQKDFAEARKAYQQLLKNFQDEALQKRVNMKMNAIRNR